MLHLRFVRPSRGLALMGAAMGWMAAGCGAEPTPPSNEGGAAATANGGSTPSAGGMAGMGGVGGAGGSGGASLCDMDCDAIDAPDCFIAVCNDGMYPGPVGSCVVVAASAETTCDDGMFCTTNDTCLDGVCVGGPPNDCGMTAPQCEQVACDEEIDGCTTEPVADGEQCSSDTNLCQVGMECINGACVGGTPNDCFLAPVPSACFNPVCNPITGMCEPIPGNDGASCIDETDLCSKNNTCAAGVCQGGAPLDCSYLTAGCDLGVCNPMDGLCAVQAVLDGQGCNDLSACTTGEICTTGICGGGTPVTVCETIGDGCCPAACDETTDQDCAVQSSCLAIKTSVPTATDGIYTIDPDGPGPSQQIQVYCDMTSDQGGWTLIARFANSDPENWMLDTGEWWYAKTTPTGATTDRSINADMISEAFWTVVANELRISRTDNASDAHLLMTNMNCLGTTDFRSFITSFGNFQSADWPSNTVQGNCPASLGANYATTNGFAQATCVGSPGAANSISFWAHQGTGDGSVMMIGGGGTACDRADHGIGITEDHPANFTTTVNNGEDDFGDDANSSNTANNDPYALNLWVR